MYALMLFVNAIKFVKCKEVPDVYMMLRRYAIDQCNEFPFSTSSSSSSSSVSTIDTADTLQLTSLLVSMVLATPIGPN